MSIVRTLWVAASLLAAVGPAAAIEGGDAAKGETVFKKCMVCHRIGEGAKSLVGPALTGVIGRTPGTFPGFAYSAINKAAGEAGLTWTDDNIFNYLNDPNTFLRTFLASKGKTEFATQSTKMAFKLADEQERKDVIAYLKKFSPGT